METESFGYIGLIGTLATTILAVAAVLAAYKAMKRGLTYSATRAVVLVLIFVGLADLIHLLSESVPALARLEDYQIDHIVSMLGYGSFLFLERRSARLKVPEKTPPSA